MHGICKQSKSRRANANENRIFLQQVYCERRTMNIIPKPFDTKILDGTTVFSASTQIECACDVLRHEIGFLDYEQAEKNILAFEIGPTEYDYELIINGNIIVRANTNEGLFHGCMTLKQLIFDGYQDGVAILKNCIIYDKPRFEYRSFMLDIVRHFFDKDVILKIIDILALVKINTLHLHLSDNQGYRVESEVFPVLNEKANMRKCTKGDNIPVGGYLSKNDVKEIVEYAKQRYIDIVPEVDLPGHTLAFLVAMPERSCSGKQFELAQDYSIDSRILCAGNEDNYIFIEQLIGELCELFPSPYFHIGGDEVPKSAWSSCEKCLQVMDREGLDNCEQLQGYFTNRVINIIKKRGKTPIVWNEALDSGMLDESAVCQLWTDYKSKEFEKDKCEATRKKIVSKTKPYYVDYPHGINNLKSVYNFDPLTVIDDEHKQNVIGIETPLWTELVHTVERLHQQAFPRVIAVAEAGWSTGEKDYDDFVGRLYNVLGILEAYDIGYTPMKNVNPNKITSFVQKIKFWRGLTDWNILTTIKNTYEAKSKKK